MFKDPFSYKILVIEDNAGDFLLISDYLEEFILAPIIHHSRTFAEANKLISERDCPYDIVFLDLSLPDKKGESLIMDIIQFTLPCPVIVLSGYADIEFSVKSLSLGISDYLLKDDLTPSSLYKCILYNIERKKLFSDLAENEKRYSDLFHLSPQAMYVYDMTTLRFLDVNEAAVNHYGYSKEEFMVMTIEDIRPEEDIENLRKILLDTSQDELKYKQLTGRHKTKSGKIILVDIQSNYIKFKNKEARVILANDITERITYIKTIEEQNKKLKEISWIQSHEVRAPLARLMSVVQLIQEENKEEDRDLMYKYILDSANELDQIIRKISVKAEAINSSFSD